MKYKVGDKVKIREDLGIGQAYGTCFITPNMHNLCGEIVHITEVNENRGEYRISPYPCWWTDEMFEDIDTKYKIGDKVRIRRDLSVDDLCVNGEMLPLAGELATIARVYNDRRDAYEIDIDHGSWIWYESMFESVDTDEKKMNKRVVIEVEGGKIVARCGNKLGEAYYHFNDNFYTCAKIALEQLEKAENPYAWLKEGMTYYTPDIVVKTLYSSHIYSANDADERFKEYGIAFRTEAEAIECAKKILYVIKQEG